MPQTGGGALSDNNGGLAFDSGVGINGCSSTALGSSDDDGAIYVSDTGNDDNAGTQSAPVKTISKAYELVSGEGTIVLLSNITQSSTLTLSSEKTVTLTSDSDQTFNVIRGTTSTLIELKAGSLTLTDVIIDGNSTGTDFLIKVGSTSGNPSLTLGSGATVKNGSAGGILLGVDGNAGNSHGTLTIDGGTVSGCGGKVFTLGGSTQTSVAGIAVIGSYTHFTMNSGSVTGNLNKIGSNREYAGGIIFAWNNKDNSSAVINGGTISGNEGVNGAGGILIDSDGKVVLNGGKITGNKGSKTYGGGVGLWATTSSLSIGGDVTASLVIKGNTDSDGNASNLMLHDSVVVTKAAGGLAAGSEVHILHKSIQDGGTSKVKVVASSSSGAEDFFVSDKPYVVGILRDSDSAIYLSPDAREGRVIYVNADSGSSTPDGTITNPYKTIQAAYSAANTNDTIVLLSDITISSQVQFSSSKKVTIASGWEGGKKYAIKSEYKPSSTASSQDYLFYITSGSVTFKDVTIDGDDQENYPGAIKADNGAIVTLGAGVTVQNFDSSASSPGQAVLNAQASGSTLIIDGATITGCTLSGGDTGNPASIICSGEAATVGMRSGSITGNTLDCEGSSIVNLGKSKTPKFYMTGGSITNNTVTSGYGALYTCGNASSCDIRFGGSAIVYDNTDSGGNQKNIMIKNSGATDTSSCLKLQSSLTGDAKLGISASNVGESTLVITGTDAYTVTADDASHIESDKTNVAVVFDKADSKIKLSIEAMDEVYVSETKGDDTTGDGTRSNPVKTISKAYGLVKSGGKILLLTDISQGNLELNKSKDVTIASANNTEGDSGAKKIYKISRNTDANLFKIKSGTLALQDVVLTDAAQGRYKALVRICSGAELVLDSGAAVKDVYLTTDSSGTTSEWGILVAEAGGTITMKDGSSIESCRATSGPVRISGSNARFNMEGGTISNCDSSYQEGNAVYVAGGATFTMSGGLITECGLIWSSLKGTIYLHNSGTNNYVMTGGEVTGNKASYGGGVYSAYSSNTITVSGTAKIHGNTGTSMSGESNIYLYSGQTVTVGEGGLKNGADIGVYTASSPSDSSDVKLATGASAGDAKYFHSDKTTTAGIVYCNGTSDSVEGAHHTHSAGTLWLSTAAKGYTVNVALVDGVQCTTDNLDQSCIGGTKTFKDIVLTSASGYVTLTQGQADAIDSALSGTGLTAAYDNGNITIKEGTGLNENVSLDLATILTGDLAPKQGEAKIGETVYTRLSEALNAAKSDTGKDTIEIVSSSVTAVTGADLKSGDVLKDHDGNSYTATSDSKINVGTDGSVTLTSGALDVKKGENGDAPLTVITDGYTVTGSDFSVSVGDGGESTLTVTAEKEAEIDGAAFGPGIYTLSKSDGKMDAVLSANASVSGSDGVKIVGVDPGTGGKSTEVEIDGTTGKVTLIGGKGIITGEETVSVRTTGGSSETVEVTVPKGTTATIDADDGAATVDKGHSITVGDITYTSGNDGGSSFSITECKLTNNGDSVKISGSADSDKSVALGDGESPKMITIPGENKGDAVVTKGSSSSTVEIGKTGDSFTVDGKAYEAGSDSASFEIDGSGNVKIESGSVLIGDGTSVTGGSGKAIENPSGTGTDKVEVEAGESKDAVTVPASGKVDIGGTVYENASDSVPAVIEATGSGDKLVEGSIKLVKDKGIEVNGVSVERTDSESGDISVNVISGGSGSMVVPQSGAVKFDNTTITSASGSSSIDIGTDGKLVVTVPASGQVTIGEKTYSGTGGSGMVLTVNPKTGKVDGATNIILTDENLKDSNFSMKLETEQVITAGKYTYTAAGGDATFRSRGVDSSGKALNPAVVLEYGKTVHIGLSADKAVSTTYTATAAGTKIAMSSDDADTKKVDLLAGGLSGIKGVTVTGGQNTITAVDSDARIELADGDAELTSGQGSSSGKMGVAFTDIGSKAFDGNGTRYTVSVSEKKLTLDQAGSVKMNGNVTFTGKAGSSFALVNKGDGVVSTTVLKGESITGSDGLSIEGTVESGSGQGAEVKIGTNGKLTLVEGTATVKGKGTLSVVLSGSSGSGPVSVYVPEGKSYTVDPSAGTISGFGEGDTIVINGVTYTSKDGKSEFELDSRKGALTLEGDSAVIPDSESATITLGSGTNAKTVGVDNSSSPNSGNVTITKGGGDAGGTVEIATKGDKVTIGGNTYTAPCNNAEYIIDSGGDVRIKITLSEGEKYELNPGETVTVGDHTYTAPDGEGSQKGNVVLEGRAEELDPAVILKDVGDSVTVGIDGSSEAGVQYKAGSAETKFAMSEDDTDAKKIDLLEEGSKVSSVGGVTVNGGGSAITTVNGSTAIELQGGKATLVAGTATVSDGKAYVNVDGSKAVEAVAPEGTTVTLDADGKTAKVDEGKSVVIDGVTYTSGSTGGSSFALDGGKLTSDGDKAAVPGGKAASITIGDGTSPTVQVPRSGGSNAGNVVITKTSDGGSVRIEKAGDGFEVGGNTYVAGSDGATFTVDASGDVKLTSGSATVDGGKSIETSNGNVITGSEGTAKITVGDGKDTVTITTTGGKVKIGDDEYTSAGDDTKIDATGSGNELIEGSVLLDEDERISIDGITVKGDGTKPVKAETTGDGTAAVTVPEGGQAVIGGATIGGSDGAVIDIADGKTVVEIDAGKDVTINGKDYKGGDNGTTRTIGEDGTVQQSKVTIDTGSGSSAEEEIDVGDTIKLPDEKKVEPPKPQQVLVGWKATDEKGEETEYGIGSDYTVEGDAKVEAVYADSSKVLVYTVNSNGGSVTGTTYEELDGSPVKLKDDGVQKEGYTFAGWKAKDGNDAVYAPGVSLGATQTTYMEAYFIKDSAQKVTLTYEPENGSASVTKQTVKAGDTVWLPTSLDMSRPGYTFKGWATESDTENEPAALGAEASATAGRTMIKTSCYTVKEDETLYAVWEEDSSDHPGWWEDDDDSIWHDPTVVPSDDSASGGDDAKRIALIVAAIAVAITELAVLIAYRKK